MSSLGRFLREDFCLPSNKFKRNPLVAASAISAGASVASGIAGSVAASNLNHRNRVFQREENEKARNFQREMWERTNAYNSPANQRQLAEEAGYNPYLYEDTASQGASSLPSSPSYSAVPSSSFVNPLQGLGSVATEMLRLSQSQEQIDSNKSLQYIEGLEKLFDIQVKAYKEGGQSLVNQIQKEYDSVFKSFDWSNSFYSQRLQREFLSMDIENERNEIARSVESLYSKDTAKQVLSNLSKTNESMDAQISLLNSNEKLNDATIKRMASEIARNFAEAFSAHKQGEYYEVSAEQMSIINKVLDMQEKDAEADFAFNSDVRKFKKQIPNRSLALGLYTQSLGAQSVQKSIQGNAFLQNFKEYSSAIGNMFKVNFGLSSNRTNFNNLTPNSGSKMFYSGDGYYMNNGVLMKGSW